MFIVQSTIGHWNLCTQIQKFWNICSDLNFKDDSFYPFKVFSGKISPKIENSRVSWLQSKIFFPNNHGEVKDVRAIFISLILVTTFPLANSNHVLAPAKGLHSKTNYNKTNLLTKHTAEQYYLICISTKLKDDTATSFTI